MKTENTNTTNAAREAGQKEIRIVNGMQCVKVRRGLWRVLETKAGQRTGRTIFTGTLSEIKGI